LKEKEDEDDKENGIKLCLEEMTKQKRQKSRE